MKKLLVLFLAFLFLLLAGCNNAATTEDAVIYESYESNEKKQEMMQLKYVDAGAVYYADETRKIKGKTLWVILQYEISPGIFKYTAEDFGIKDASKIEEIKDLGLSEWKYDPYNLGEEFTVRRELQIILKKSDEDYLLELAKRIYELPFVYTVSVDYKEGPYTDLTSEDEIQATTVKKDFPDFENKEKAKQYMIKREYSDKKYLDIPKRDDLICKEIYVSLMREVSLWEFEYTAADFGITDLSKIKEIKNDTTGDKTYSYYRQEVNIILNEISTTDAKALAQKIHDLPFVKSVTLEYVFETLPEVLESNSLQTDGGDDAVAKIFEKFANSISSKPIVMLNSFEEFESITKELQATDSTDEDNYSASSKYAEQTKKYTKEFFEKNTLFMAYFIEGSISYGHRITGLNISNVMSVQISTIIPHESVFWTEGGFVVFFELPKEKVKNVEKIELTNIKEKL